MRMRINPKTKKMITKKEDRVMKIVESGLVNRQQSKDARDNMGNMTHRKPISSTLANQIWSSV